MKLRTYTGKVHYIEFIEPSLDNHNWLFRRRLTARVVCKAPIDYRWAYGGLVGNKTKVTCKACIRLKEKPNAD